MTTVRDVLSLKTVSPREVVTTTHEATVLEAARLMVDHGIGGLPVLGTTTGELLGIFTERDLLRRVVAEGRDPARTRVGEVMTSPVVVGRPDTPIAECAALMTNRRLRHLPIVVDDRLEGMLTIGDVLASEVDEQRTTIEELNRYVFAMR